MGAGVPAEVGDTSDGAVAAGETGGAVVTVGDASTGTDVAGGAGENAGGAATVAVAGASVAPWLARPRATAPHASTIRPGPRFAPTW